MQRSIESARGRLINIQVADEIFHDLADLIKEIQASGRHTTRYSFVVVERVKPFVEDRIGFSLSQLNAFLYYKLLTNYK